MGPPTTSSVAPPSLHHPVEVSPEGRTGLSPSAPALAEEGGDAACDHDPNRRTAGADDTIGEARRPIGREQLVGLVGARIGEACQENQPHAGASRHVAPAARATTGATVRTGNPTSREEGTESGDGAAVVFPIHTSQRSTPAWRGLATARSHGLVDVGRQGAAVEILDQVGTRGLGRARHLGRQVESERCLG